MPRPPEQLDIPLVWEVDPPRTARPASPPPRRATPASSPWLRQLAAALADLGAVLLALGVAITVALVSGAPPAGVALATVVGIEVATVVGVGCLWGWRGTPGMLLLTICAGRPLPLGRAFGFWFVWLATLPLLSSPLLVHAGGRSLLARLAGSGLSSR